MIISMRIRMQGFVVFDYESKYAEARKELAQWLSQGKLKRKETVIKGGITKSEEALVALFEGRNTGMSAANVIWLWERYTNENRQNYGSSGGSRGCQGEVVALRERLRKSGCESNYINLQKVRREVRHVTTLYCYIKLSKRVLAMNSPSLSAQRHPLS